MNAEELLKKIEDKRQEMIELSLNSSRVDVNVVKVSDHLDQLLNKYHESIMNQ